MASNMDQRPSTAAWTALNASLMHIDSQGRPKVVLVTSDDRLGAYLDAAACSQYFATSTVVSPGETASTMFAQRDDPTGLIQRSLAESPDLVLIWIGAEDIDDGNLTDHHNERSAVAQVIFQISLLYTSMNIPNLVIPLPPRASPIPPSTSAWYSKRKNRVNAFLQKLLRFDQTFVLMPREVKNGERFAADGVHLDDLGYSLLMQLIDHLLWRKLGNLTSSTELSIHNTTPSTAMASNMERKLMSTPAPEPVVQGSTGPSAKEEPSGQQPKEKSPLPTNGRSTTDHSPSTAAWAALKASLMHIDSQGRPKVVLVTSDDRVGAYLDAAASSQYFATSTVVSPGETASTMFAQRDDPTGLIQRSLAGSPDLVLIYIGAEDIDDGDLTDHHNERSAVAQVIFQISLLYTSRNISNLVFALPPRASPILPSTSAWYSKRKCRVNAFLKHALRYDKTFVFQPKEVNHSERFAADGVHLDDLGYSLLMTRVGSLLWRNLCNLSSSTEPSIHNPTPSTAMASNTDHSQERTGVLNLKRKSSPKEDPSGQQPKGKK